MSNPRKQRGTTAETQACGYLQRIFPEVHRLAPAGANDKGDLGGIPDLTIQVKNHKTMALASWVDEAAKQAANGGNAVFVVIHKRRGKSDPGQWYVTTTLEVFADTFGELLT
jgi:hypothetical protein